MDATAHARGGSRMSTAQLLDYPNTSITHRRADVAHFTDYAARLSAIMAQADWGAVAALAADLQRCWREGRSVFICGNGGSAGNAIHLANDYLYGIAKDTGLGLRVHALAANASVLTCLANDVGYDSVFSSQLAVQGNAGDLLLVFSGSGNSPNIIKVL